MRRSDAPLLSIPQTAEVMGVSKHTVERMISRGELDAFKIGGRRFIRRRDVVRM